MKALTSYYATIKLAVLTEEWLGHQLFSWYQLPTAPWVVIEAQIINQSDTPNVQTNNNQLRH